MWSVLASNMGSKGASNSFSVKATLSSSSTKCLSSGSRMSVNVSCSKKTSVYERLTSQDTYTMHTQVPLGEHNCSGCTVGFPGPLVVSISEQRLICQMICCILDTKSMVWYTGAVCEKNVKSLSIASLWFHNAVSLWFSVRLTMVFHTHGTCNIRLLIINCKLYLDKYWQMSHTNPKVTEVLLFRYRIRF